MIGLPVELRFQLALLLTTGLLGTVSSPTSAQTVDFEKEIAPILADACLDCHGADTQESGLRLDIGQLALRGGDSGEPLIVAGKPEQSFLWHVLADTEADIQMPPDGSLPETQLNTIRAWLEQGATWPKNEDVVIEDDRPWSFLPLQSPTVPLPQSAGASPIDSMIEARLIEHSLEFNPIADRGTLIRRLDLVTTGLLPSPQQIDAFIADDRPDAFSRRVDRQLASAGFGERWGRHWLDVVRFAETSGFETNVPRPNAYHYRDWVIRSLNDDLPFRDFVYRQLAGDTVLADAATGFLVGGPYDQVKSTDPVLTANQRQDELTDMINTTGTAFLGLTLGCARCHNHKFDPVSQTDFYAMQAVFAGVQHGTRPLRQPANELRRQQELDLRQRLGSLQQQLAVHQSTTSPLATAGVVQLAEQASPLVTHLVVPQGEGTLQAKGEPGDLDDPGTADRLPHLGGKTYTWWKNSPGEPVIRYAPTVSGHYEVWVSWGAGYTTHSQDARYVLDLDGDWSTSEDRQIIGQVDQQQLAAALLTELNARPKWSGYRSLGVHALTPEAALFLVGGETGSALTADQIALAPAETTADKTAANNNAQPPHQPPLREPISSRENQDWFEPVQTQAVRFYIHKTNASEPCLDELEVWSTGPQPTNVALAAPEVHLSSSGDLKGYAIHQLEHLNDGLVGNDHSWIAASASDAWVQVEWDQPVTIDHVVWGRDRNGAFADRTPTQYEVQVLTASGQWQVVASSDDRAPGTTSETTTWLVHQYSGLSPDQAASVSNLLQQIQQVRAELAQYSTDQSVVYAGSMVAPPDTHRLYRGDPTQPREVVSPAPLSELSDLVGGFANEDLSQEANRREALAQWLTADSQPLVFRVMANRLWHYTFGRGIVATPSDFGNNGIPPTHPELVDWLAVELRQDDSVKSVLRDILVSRTFQQSAIPNPQALASDADARWWWRYPPRRLEGEVIRDNVLKTAGTLRRDMYGPGFSVFLPNDNYVRNYVPKSDYEPQTWRRMVYMFKVRMERDAVFGAFDTPDAGQVCPKRTDSTTALQALNLLNSEFILDQAEHFAQRLEAEAGSKPESQVRRAFELLYGRTADEDEVAMGSELIQTHGLEAFCRAVWNTNEFLFIP